MIRNSDVNRQKPPMVEKLEKYVVLYGKICSIICKVTTTTGLNVI